MKLFNTINLPEEATLQIEGENYAILHNLLIDEMEAYLEIVFNEAAPIDHIQKQAYLKGRIDLLKSLLNKEM